MGKPNSKITSTLAFTLIPVFFSLNSCSKSEHLPDWIHGNWITSLDGETIHENWKPGKHCIRGENYMLYENKFQREKLRIYEKGQQLYYRIVIEKDTLLFTCKNYRNTDTLTFVNNQNPFPKRISYVRPKQDKMSVWIENTKNDPNGIHFTFKKVK